MTMSRCDPATIAQFIPRAEEMRKPVHRTPHCLGSWHVAFVVVEVADVLRLAVNVIDLSVQR